MDRIAEVFEEQCIKAVNGLPSGMNQTFLTDVGRFGFSVFIVPEQLHAKIVKLIDKEFGSAVDTSIVVSDYTT